MRIVHVIDYFQPKLGYQETFLAREQSKMGHNVHVVTSDRYSPIAYQGDVAKQLLGKRVKGSGYFVEERIQTIRLKVLFEFPHGIWLKGLEKTISELKPDIVHVHGVTNITTVRIAIFKRKKLNFKLICDDHMLFRISDLRLFVLNKIFRHSFAQTVFKAADALVAATYTSKLYMNKYYGYPQESIKVIPLGADHHLFKFDKLARDEIRSDLFLHDNIVFIYTGKLLADKEVHLFIQAALLLMKKNDNIRVLIIGDGSEIYKTRLKRMIEDAQCDNKFLFLDAVPNSELNRYYSAADVAVWPKQATISMIEAMASGLPIIINDGSEVTKRVEHENGFTFAEGDCIDLSAKMEKLLNKELRERMGHNARKLVEEYLNWTLIARQFIDAVEPIHVSDIPTEDESRQFT